MVVLASGSGSTFLPCDFYLTWTADSSIVGSVKIGELSLIWGELAPYDLSAISQWNGKRITELSLSFRRSGTGNLDDYPVRVGWVRLTE